jgi:hypothetical protein
VPLIFCPYYTSAEVVTTVGVDTHKDVHVAVALVDALGRDASAL